MFLDICEDTLRKHYRRELDTGKIRGNAAMARRLFKAGTEDGSVAAMIFWMKSQAGWTEKSIHELVGPGGGPVQHIHKIERTIVSPENPDR